MAFSITPAYALLAALVWLILWFRVTAMRASLGRSIGDGGDQALLLRIRQHGNCADWTVFILILMAMAEGARAQGVYLHLSGALLLIGRIAHPFGLTADNAGHPLRYIGNGANILAALTAMAALAVSLLTR